MQIVQSISDNTNVKFIFFSGATCGGNCCNNVTEQELRQKAADKFEQLLHHHTSSLRGILETTASQFQSEYTFHSVNTSVSASVNASVSARLARN